MLSMLANLKNTLAMALFLAGGLLFSNTASAQINFVNEAQAALILQSEVSDLQSTVSGGSYDKVDVLTLEYYTLLMEDATMGVPMSTAIVDAYQRSIGEQLANSSLGSVTPAFTTEGQRHGVYSGTKVQSTATGGNQFIDAAIDLLKI